MRKRHAASARSGRLLARFWANPELWYKYLKYNIHFLGFSIPLKNPSSARYAAKSLGKPKQIGQQHLCFVRRGVCCCSAVARGSLPLPSPSLGVSSLDLGRSRKVSGPFSFPKGFSNARRIC